MNVGKVESYELERKSTWVNVRVHIDRRYAPLVRRNTKFWNVSGIDVEAGLLGAEVDAESLQSAIAGGVAFATPDSPGEPVEEGAIFHLYDEPGEDWLNWTPVIELKG